jgi:hypothetical protein
MFKKLRNNDQTNFLGDYFNGDLFEQNIRFSAAQVDGHAPVSSAQTHQLTNTAFHAPEGEHLFSPSDKLPSHSTRLFNNR